MSVIAIIPAAGLGTRMTVAGKAATGKQAASLSKQFIEIDGVPILIHTLAHFGHCKKVNSIVVALRAAEIEPFRERLSREPFAKKVELVEGGENRQESVAKA